jgi:hypothetical protein
MSDERRCACSIRLSYPTANEAVGFFRDNWNWIKDRIPDRIDDGQFIDGEVAIQLAVRLSIAARGPYSLQGKRIQFKMFPAHPLQALPEASTLTGMPTPEESNDSLICQRHSAR